MLVELHQFNSSHFNEKARWALDYKTVPHRRVSYLPGPHRSAIKKITNGSTSTTPVLVADTVLQGSAKIIEFLERSYPDKKLYPEQPEQALAWQTRLDLELGPAVRTVVFAVLVHETAFLAETFTRDMPYHKKFTYRFMLPLLTPLIKKANGADSEDNILHCEKVVLAYLEEIAEATKATGYLVGDSFTVADLTAAALLAPLVRINHDDMRRPEPIPQTMLSLFKAYETYPAISWVQRMYQQHRPR